MVDVELLSVVNGLVVWCWVVICSGLGIFVVVNK